MQTFIFCLTLCHVEGNLRGPVIIIINGIEGRMPHYSVILQKSDSTPTNDSLLLYQRDTFLTETK